MDLSQYLISKNTIIENRLGELVPEKNMPYHSLFTAARYSLLEGGKRLRPILALATLETLGGDFTLGLDAACALEMVHTYSLIHDDLPCMDDDDFRRGKPSLHKVFPEGHAVLTGDFLLTHAFDILANDPILAPEKKVKLIAILSRSCGGDGMIAGQVIDMESEGKEVDIDMLRLMHSCKTGAMISASVEFGAVLANVSEAQLRLLHGFGRDIGLAFQIVDDVLDVTASKKKHGKEIASDTMNRKSTYVTVLGIEASQKLANTLLQQAIEQVKQLPYEVTLLVRLAECFVNRNS